MVTTAAAAHGTAGPPAFDGELRIELDPVRSDTLHVHGPVLPTTAERLRTRLDIESHAGTRSLTVNLDDVTHLASAGVRILQQADRVARRQHSQLILTARPGSIAHDVLHLLGSPPADEPR
jgi:anti-anti-sigma regulatory factor